MSFQYYILVFHFKQCIYYLHGRNRWRKSTQNINIIRKTQDSKYRQHLLLIVFINRHFKRKPFSYQFGDFFWEHLLISTLQINLYYCQMICTKKHPYENFICKLDYRIYLPSSHTFRKVGMLIYLLRIALRRWTETGTLCQTHLEHGLEGEIYRQCIFKPQFSYLFKSHNCAALKL